VSNSRKSSEAGITRILGQMRYLILGWSLRKRPGYGSADHPN